MTSRAIALPFSFTGDGQIYYTEDEKKMWQDRVVLVIMTLKGERVMRPTFGTETREQSLENISSAIANIESAVAKGFMEWLAPLTLTGTEVTVDDDYMVTIQVKYTYGRNTVGDTVTVKTDIFNPSGDVIIGASRG